MMGQVKAWVTVKYIDTTIKVLFIFLNKTQNNIFYLDGEIHEGAFDGTLVLDAGMKMRLSKY